jgi:hypothetical protein
VENRGHTGRDRHAPRARRGRRPVRAWRSFCPLHRTAERWNGNGLIELFPPATLQ